MRGRIVRGSMSALAALSIATGGVVFAGGTAAGEAWEDSNTPWWWDEVLSNTQPTCDTNTIPPYWATPVRCYASLFGSERTLGDYSIGLFGPKDAAPGAGNVFTVIVRASEAAFDVPNPEEDVDVTSVTFQPPKGFEFRSVEVEDWPQNNPFPVLDSAVVVDPDSGEITVTAPDGGWRISQGGFIRLKFTLQAPATHAGQHHGRRGHRDVDACVGWVGRDGHHACLAGPAGGHRQLVRLRRL